MQQQISFLDSLCGKMSQEPSAATAEKTSTPSSGRSAPSAKTTLMCLDLRGGGGNLLGAYWETDTVLPGVSMTLNTGESPSDVNESTLSQILDLDAPEKYCLSPKACAGIVRRAKKRGKELPDMLREALMEVILSAGGMEQFEDGEPDEEIDEENEELMEDDEDMYRD